MASAAWSDAVRGATGQEQQAAPPVIHARDLRTLREHYRRVQRFELLQEISGVVAILRRGALTLQLWQSGECAARNCTIRLDRSANVFQLFSELAKVARSALVEECPRLRPWGAWEFTLCDPQGNALTSSQSATECV